MAGASLLTGLNDPQSQAVLHRGGPLLILAGAGSGKTRVITVRIAHLIKEAGIEPRSILAVTFTNKAAAEMRERAAALVPEAAQVMIRTFHAFGAWFLRMHAQDANLKNSFTIYDDDDQKSLLGTLFPSHNKQQIGNDIRAISRAKDYARGPEDTWQFNEGHPELPKIYASYEKRLREIGNVDFGDLILRPLEILRENDAIRERIRHRFRVILVDEYQDSNVAQYELLRQLASDDAELCVVGDDDQSIYGFRGAEVRNILDFPERFPGTTIVRLERNYRSSQEILALADAVVEHNENRLGKTMWTERTGGSLPRLWLFDEQDREVEEILKLCIQDSDTETAILYRTNAQSRVFETAFLRAGLPYRIVGTLRFYEREEIKDSLALLKLLCNTKDEVAFRRMVNKPSRGIGEGSVEKILVVLDSADGDTLRAAEYAIPQLSKKAASGVAAFVAVMEKAAALLDGNDFLGHLGVILDRLLAETGLYAHHKEQDEVGGTQKEQNLEELLNAAAQFPATREGLSNFLETAELDATLRDNDENNAKITLITMHNTKGLEFDRVIISGLEEGVFPRPEEQGDELEEQRRLLYVALTRARNELVLTYSRRRKVFGRWTDFSPSRFLSEMPPDMLEVKEFTNTSLFTVSQRHARAFHRGAQAPADEWSGYDSSSNFGADGDVPASSTQGDYFESADEWQDFQDDFSSSGRGGKPKKSVQSGTPEPSTEDESSFRNGDRVLHTQYGQGTVLEVAQKAGSLVLLVVFDDGRRMKFLPRYTPIRRIDA